MAVVAVPVRTDRERDDRQPDPRPAADDLHRLVVVRVRKVIRVHPPAFATGGDVAPRVAFDAAVHVHRDAGAEVDHERELLVRPRTHVHAAVRVRGLGERHGRNQQRGTHQPRHCAFAHHSFSLRPERTADDTRT